MFGLPETVDPRLFREKRAMQAAALWLLRRILHLDVWRFYEIDLADFVTACESDLPEGYIFRRFENTEDVAECSSDILQQIVIHSGKGVPRIVAEGGRVYAVLNGTEVVSQLNITFMPCMVDTPFDMEVALGQNGAFLSFLYTNPSFRRQRWASRLITQVCSVLSREGQPHCLCHIQPTNIASSNTFHALRWKRVATLFASAGGRMLGLTHHGAIPGGRLRVRVLAGQSEAGASIKP